MWHPVLSANHIGYITLFITSAPRDAWSTVPVKGTGVHAGQALESLSGVESHFRHVRHRGNKTTPRGPPLEWPHRNYHVHKQEEKKEHAELEDVHHAESNGIQYQNVVTCKVVLVQVHEKPEESAHMQMFQVLHLEEEPRGRTQHQGSVNNVEQGVTEKTRTILEAATCHHIQADLHAIDGNAYLLKCTGEGIVRARL